MARDAEGQVKEFFRENWPPILLFVAIMLALLNAVRVHNAKPDHIGDANKMIVDADQDRWIANLDARLRKIESRRD